MIMKLFQAIATTAGGVWLGGMVLMAIVASTTFGVMRTTGVEHPDSIAGQVMAKNFARFDTVFVHHTQGPKPHVLPIDVLSERKCVVGIKPAVVGVPTIGCFTNLDHDFSTFC